MKNLFRLLAAVSMLTLQGCETCPAQTTGCAVVFSGFTDQNGNPMNRDVTLTLLNQPIFNGLGLTYSPSKTYHMQNFTLTVSNLAAGNYNLSLQGLNRQLGMAVTNDLSTHNFMDFVTNQLPNFSTTRIGYAFDTNFFTVSTSLLVTLKNSDALMLDTNGMLAGAETNFFQNNLSLWVPLIPFPTTLNFDGGNIKSDGSGNLSAVTVSASGGGQAGYSYPYFSGGSGIGWPGGTLTTYQGHYPMVLFNGNTSGGNNTLSQIVGLDTYQGLPDQRATSITMFKDNDGYGIQLQPSHYDRNCSLFNFCWYTGLYIAGNGNIGVNTTSPQYQLDVNGTLHVSGAVTFDTPLTSLTFTNANGAKFYLQVNDATNGFVFIPQ